MFLALSRLAVSLLNTPSSLAERNMKRLSTPSFFSIFCIVHRTSSILTTRSRFQSLHISSTNHAIPLPTTATGPPPSPPISANEVKIIRRQRQAELLRHGRDLRAGQKNSSGNLKKRFWKDVSVQTDSGTTSFTSALTDCIAVGLVLYEKTLLILNSHL